MLPEFAWLVRSRWTWGEDVWIVWPWISGTNTGECSVDNSGAGSRGNLSWKVFYEYNLGEMEDGISEQCFEHNPPTVS